MGARASDFSLPLWARQGWVQTLGALFWPSQTPQHPDFEVQSHTAMLPDGDALALTLYEHRHDQDRRRVVLVHGLCGDQASNYMRRSADRLLRAGYEICMVNLRGSGPGHALASQPYHAGRSEDVAAVIKWLKARRPNQPLDLIGFSLGANIVLKYLAEASRDECPKVERAMAISPPIDLEQSSNCLTQSPFALADRFFCYLLVQHVNRVHQSRADLGPPPAWPKRMTVRQFDELYTAPRAGFASAKDYYQQASSAGRLHEIKIPTKIIWAKDDPLIDQVSLAHVKVSNAVQTLATEHGGHIGYLDPRLPGQSRFWLIDAIPGWLDEL